MNEQERLYTGPVNQDNRKVPEVPEEPILMTKVIGPIVTIIVTLIAFASGYGSLKTLVDQKVSKEDYQSGFIEWTGWRGNIEATMVGILADINRLNPDKDRFGYAEFDRGIYRLNKDIEENALDIELLKKRVEEVCNETDE